MKKLFYSAASLALYAAPMAVAAQPTNGGLTDITDINLNGDVDLINLIGRVINILLGFLGVIALVIIIVAGFQWMTAAGNEEKVEGAKKMLGAGVIGLVIIVASLAIANFVINNLKDVSGGTF